MCDPILGQAIRLARLAPSVAHACIEKLMDQVLHQAGEAETCLGYGTGELRR